MAAKYSEAPAVKKVAQKLIPKHHQHLVNERIGYVFRDKHARSKGKAVLGKAHKITGLNAFLSSDFDIDAEEYFVIEIAGDFWRAMTEKQREALVDHELSHCFVDQDDNGKTVRSILPHDLEEFASIVKRHGLWEQDLQHFVRVAGDQLQMDVAS